MKGTKRIGEYVTEVVFVHSGFTLKENKTYFVNDRVLGKICEVIGNIYENPELLNP